MTKKGELYLRQITCSREDIAAKAAARIVLMAIRKTNRAKKEKMII